MIESAWLETNVVTEAELSVGSGSLVEVMIVAVLVSRVASATEELTVTTRVAVAEAPGARSRKLTRRLLPEPVQEPPALAEQDRNVVPAGRVSAIVKEPEELGPRFVIVKE
jgi:hypothetical protein